MRKLVVALSLISVTFAATTAYYATELRNERARNAAEVARRDAQVLAAAAARPVETTPAPALAIASTPPAPSAQSAESVATASPQGVADPDERVKRQLVEFSKRFLEQIADPARRAAMLAERRRGARTQYPRIAERLGLAPDEYERLLDLLAEQDFGYQERMSRCVLDPECNYRNFNRDDAKSRPLQIADLLGGDRAQRFEEYQNSLSEREIVTQLRARLTDNAYLSSELSESLILALADERARFEAEMRQTGTNTAGFGMTNGWIYYASGGSAAERLESATVYTRRMRDRAAQVLNADQLTVFEQMQESLLLNLRGQLEKRETASTKQ